jgi:hypothetical protein
MAISQPSLPFRFAHSSLQLALRFWPKESLHWGRALAAELHEIDEPLEAIHWAFGGLMLFTRATASHILTWLKLPVGSRLSVVSLPLETNPPLLPKRSRLFTAAVLLATALLLLLPQSREAISTVRASWNGYLGTSGDLRALQKLAARAIKEKDAHTLAFVALVAPDPEVAAGLADHAVALDPSLTWMYASRSPRPEYTPPPKDGLARLLAADSENAFPEILAAQVICEPRMQTLIAQHSLTPQATEAALAANSEWVTHMDRAFRAPRYDSYFNRRWQLTHEVWNSNPNVSVALIFNSLWSQPFPDFLSIKSYADILMQKAHQASDAGHPEQAESLLREVDSFGRRVTEQGELDLEKLLGRDVSRRATIALRDFYQRLGRKSESQEAAKQLQLIDDRRDNVSHSFFFHRIEEPRLHALERNALRVQISAILALLSACLAAVCLIALEWRSRKSAARRVWLRRGVCLAADWVPAILLLACAALLWFFQPYAEILRSARTVTSGSAAWYSMHFGGLFTLSSALGALEEPFTPLHFWESFTCALVALALFILVRGFLRYKRA